MGHPYLTGPYPRAYAHRGWHVGDLAGCENTLAAIGRAVDEGFAYVEVDVHATADGVAVLHHDLTLDRTTDATGRVAARTAAELAAVRVRGREPIPRLAEVLAALPDTRFTIELKTGRALGPVLADLQRADAFARVCLAGYADAWLDRARERVGSRLFTSMGQASAVGMRAQAWRESLGSVLGPVLPGPISGLAGRIPAIPVQGDLAQLPYRLGPLPVADPGLLRSVRASGRELHVWTVNNAAAMDRMLDLGVDGILSDRPDLLRDVLRRRGAWTGNGEGTVTGGGTVTQA